MDFIVAFDNDRKSTNAENLESPWHRVPATTDQVKIIDRELLKSFFQFWLLYC